MQRSKRIFSVESPHEISIKMLTWAAQFDTHLWLDSNDYHPRLGSYDALLAVGVHSRIDSSHSGAFDALQAFHSKTKDWLFGYLSYDLKNDVEQLQSSNTDNLAFPELFFFQPKKIWLLRGNQWEAHYINDHEITSDWHSILEAVDTHTVNDYNDLALQARIEKNEYIEKVTQLLQHIQRGDIYEVNFCMEWFSKGTQIHPLKTFMSLNELSKPPFAAYFKDGDRYVLSASPERYLRKEGYKLFSQPIKGTAPRSDVKAADSQLAFDLENNAKERSENIMIVDLVRNDLSKTAIPGSVSVDELCETYSFKQVHQMISTITSRLKAGFSGIDAIKTTFPMGSMTGAPKLRAMELIEEYERSKRSLYSGAIGYLTPQGDFDFNVVIRSILYNASNQYVSFQVGSAITSNSVPENEYKECLLKAKAMYAVLTEPITT
ncbi:MAG: anthranilate synthase component I family protein [Flavobacteriaceae bacterium]|nr:anthranilate synthase component I family protein [Flavobacteriaceae bacterium]MDG2315180.1 anthranilate synthase component I family protein [Flavobacteriaceae bacterium]